MPRPPLLLAVLATIAACNTDVSLRAPTDDDNDGYSYENDCDDTDASINPGATEIYYDGHDNDCDPSTPDDDLDGDGYLKGADCDDTDPEIRPGADEVCDGIDNDCDGEIDDDDPDLIDATTWYVDEDADTYGAERGAVEACEAPAGYVDAFGDCDDEDAAVNPDAEEICDGIDNDCNGAVDDAPDAATWYPDNDADGYGDASAGVLSCDQPVGYVSDSSDCDDNSAISWPGNDEICDGADNDCDGAVDEPDAIDAQTWYADADADGYGDPDTDTTACTQPSGYLADAGDCDDASANHSPAADEYCDGDDDDCDGGVDESGALDAQTWYADADADGWGASATSQDACDQPSGYAADDGDCDDADDGVHPKADEYCDDADEDCDGSVDEEALDPSAWYADDDGDGYGDPDDTTESCDAPSDHVADDTDCDDGDAAVSPAGTEVCNGYDDDCDGDVDGDDADLDGASNATWYADDDGDGWGDPDDTAEACEAPSGYIADDGYSGGDCDDGEATINPDGYEICEDGIDQDCDGADAGCSLSGDIDLGDADAVLLGVSEDNDAGYVIAAAGDVDGDGTPDLLVGAAGEATGGTNAGAAYLVLGGASGAMAPLSGSLSLADADAIVRGEASSDQVGSGLAGVGDLDGDGFDEILIGGGRTDGAYLFYGPLTGELGLSDADAWLEVGSSGDRAGQAVAGCGDVDGDGSPDLLIGDWKEDSGGTDAGAAYLVLGPVSADMSLDDAEAFLEGESDYDYAGRFVDCGGDLNGDGTPDLLVGAWGDDDAGSGAGAAYAVYGPVSGSLDLVDADGKRAGQSSKDYAGWAVADAGDVDGDGYDDALVGAAYHDSAGTDAGAAYLVLGPASGGASLASADAKLNGESGSDYAGLAVAAAGDVDGNGAADFLVGAYGDDDGGSSAGATYLLLGPVSGTMDLAASDAKLTGEADDDDAGIWAAGLGDLDGDGLPDLAVGAPGHDGAASDAGAAYLLLTSSF